MYELLNLFVAHVCNRHACYLAIKGLIYIDLHTHKIMAVFQRADQQIKNKKLLYTCIYSMHEVDIHLIDSIYNIYLICTYTCTAVFYLCSE